MSKIAFIYPGQGAQKAGMGADFYEHSETAREVYETASQLLNIDMKALCFEKNEQLDITEYTQAALVTTCLAMTSVAEEKGLKADITAGLSLGEYCALVTAGGITKEDAITTVRKRGILMQNAVPQGVGSMSAIMGLTGEEIEAVIEEIANVTVANYNCPGQIVITGEKEAVETANEKLKEAGAKRAIVLNVSGPFHSPMLKSAGEELAVILEGVDISALQIPYITNVTAEKVMDSTQTKVLLAEQVSASVRWQQSMEAMIADGVDTFIEIGPGKTLAGFMKKINPEVQVYNISVWQDVEKVMEALN